VNLRRVAAKAVADALATAITATHAAAAANCRDGDDDVEDTSSYPAIRIVTRTVEFNPWQEESLENVADAALTARELARVGDFDGRMEIRLYETYETKREALEQAVLDVLMSREGSPGNYVVTTPALTVAGVVTLYQAPVSCFLDNAEWQEEFVFEKKRMSFLTLDFSYPALVLRSAPQINEIRVTLQTGLTANAPSEVISVDETGDLDPSS
jgi:hypothetical protein